MMYAPLANNPLAAIDAVVKAEADGLSVATSGSTGTPRDVLISARAIRASALATVERLGGPGSWLLALPLERIGGALVAVRAEMTGQALTTMPHGTFTATEFARAAASVPPGRRYVSLVPTQVVRLMASDLGRDALALFDAVLVGGAAFGDGERPNNVIETYGMTETTGGCVYDGDPLRGVEVAIADDDRILICGATLADGFDDGDNSAWVTHGGVRWLRTGDLGRWHGGKLEVLGRADDIIISGAHKVHPLNVERAIAALGGVDPVVVVGVDDAEWGKRVVAVYEAPLDSVYPGGLYPGGLYPGGLYPGGLYPGGLYPDHAGAGADAVSPIPDARGRQDGHVAAELRAALREALPNYALPRDVVTTRSLPRTAGGKIDRRAAAALAAQALTRKSS